LNWGTGLLIIKDTIDLQASIYGYCGLDQLYNRIAELFSDEGQAQLASRLLFTVMIDFSLHWTYIRDGEMNTFCRAYHSAKLFSAMLNFKI